MSTHNIGFYEEISKIVSFNYHQISSHTHFISSSVHYSNDPKLLDRWVSSNSAELDQTFSKAVRSGPTNFNWYYISVLSIVLCYHDDPKFLDR